MERWLAVAIVLLGASLAWSTTIGMRLQWTDVPGAVSYRVHVRRVPTPWSTGTPITTRTPLPMTLTPGTPVTGWQGDVPADLPPGDYEVAVSACYSSGGCSALSNVKSLSVWTPTATYTVTATATVTHTPTITATPTLAPPILLDLDLTGDGRVTALDAVRALQRGDRQLAWRCLAVAVGLPDPGPA